MPKPKPIAKAVPVTPDGLKRAAQYAETKRMLVHFDREFGIDSNIRGPNLIAMNQSLERLAMGQVVRVPCF